MNNKEFGTAFENRMCDELAKQGYWVHFFFPDKKGAQPFDIIAVKHNIPIAIECKTSARKNFSITRLEEDQVLAMGKWLKCGNKNAYIAVEYKEQIIMIPFAFLKKRVSVNLDELGDEDGVYHWK